MTALRTRLAAWVERNIVAPAPADQADDLSNLDLRDGRWLG